MSIIYDKPVIIHYDGYEPFEGIVVKNGSGGGLTLCFLNEDVKAGWGRGSGHTRLNHLPKKYKFGWNTSEGYIKTTPIKSTTKGTTIMKELDLTKTLTANIEVEEAMDKIETIKSSLESAIADKRRIDKVIADAKEQRVEALTVIKDLETDYKAQVKIVDKNTKK